MKVFKYVDTTSPTQMTVAMYEMLSPEDAASVLNEIQIIANKRILGAETFGELVCNENAAEQSYTSILCCPVCHTNKIRKNGFSNDKQRYICKNCGKTFFVASKTLSSYTSQNTGKWMQFILGLIKRDTCDELSRKCQISKTTALHWRLKVFSALEYLLREVKLKGVIFADDTRFPYNFKGCHNENFIYPRNSHKRGHQNTVNNYQKNSICVLSAVDAAGHSCSKCIGFGTPNGKRLSNGFQGKLIVDDTTVLVTDGAQSYGRVVADYGITRWEKKTSVKKGGKHFPNMHGEFHIQAINGYHSRLKAFLAPFKSVASRYLPGYLMLFDYCENNKNLTDEDIAKNILEAMAHIPGTATFKTLSDRFIIPVSNGPETELWERKIPRKEQQIYREWYEKVPIAEICQKHKINRRKIYSIKEKVEKYGVHDKIIYPKPKPKNTLRPISERNWTIFLRCYREGESYVAVGRDYGLTRQRIEQIVKSVLGRPEGAAIHKKQPKSKKTTKPISSPKQLYEEFALLHIPESTLKSTYSIIGKKHGRTGRAVGEQIRKIRREQNGLLSNYAWKTERKNMNAHEYQMFLQKRNQNICDDIFLCREKHPTWRKKEIYQEIAAQYKLSLAYIQTIFLKTAKEPLPQIHIKNNHYTLKREEGYFAVQRKLLANPGLTKTTAFRMVADEMNLSPKAVKHRYYRYCAFMQQEQAPEPEEPDVAP